jgi:hypothetical protein
VSIYQDYLDALAEEEVAEAKLSEKKKVVEDLKVKLVEEMAMQGIDRITTCGYTFSPGKILRCSSKNMAALTKALHDAGLDALVSETVNANTLSAWVRRIDPDGLMQHSDLRTLIPPEVSENINMYDQIKIGLTKV